MKVGGLQLYVQFSLKNRGFGERFPREAYIPLGTHCIPIENHYKLGT